MLFVLFCWAVRARLLKLFSTLADITLSRCGHLFRDHFFSLPLPPAFSSQPPVPASPFFAAWTEKRSSGDLTISRAPEKYIASFRHNLSNFFTPVKFHGAEFQGPLWLPQRLFPNIVNFAFVLFVPAMYGAIFRFRKNHTTRTQGWYQLRGDEINLNCISGQGISESERERRKQSNLLTTKINFMAWVIEVLNMKDKLVIPQIFLLQLVGVVTPTVSVLNPILPLPVRNPLLRAVTNIVAPLFYVCAAEKDKLKKLRLGKLLCLPRNEVQPVTMYPVME